MIRQKPEFFNRYIGKNLLWATDNQALYYFLDRGSRVRQIQKLVIEIIKFQFDKNFRLIIKWLPRTNNLIKTADLGSKWIKASDDWGTCHASLSMALEFFNVNITVDCFATNRSRRASRFWSAIPLEGCEAVNFFTQPLVEEEYYYCSPPIGLIIPALKKVLNEKKCKAIFSIPLWESRNFLSYFRGAGFYEKYVKAVFYAQPFYINFQNKKSIFAGYKKFPHLFLLIEPMGDYKIPYIL